MRLGAIDLARVSLAPFHDEIEETRVAALPYLFRSVGHMQSAMDGPVGAEILAAFDGHDLVGLAFYDAGARSFYDSIRPIAALRDLAGLRIRVLASDINVAMVEALGAVPVTMPFDEVRAALRDGTIDGAENTWSNYASAGHDAIAGYYTPDRHLIVPDVLIMSQSSFERLTMPDRALVRQAARDSVRVQRTLWTARETAAEARARDTGATTATGFDRQAFVDAMAPVYRRFVTSSTIEDLVGRIRATE